MNPVLMIAYNNLSLTKDAVQSVLNQDIPVDLHFVDNGSTDGTWEWAEDQFFAGLYRKKENESPIKISNDLSSILFQSSPYVLGVPNDVRLPSNCYRELLKWPRGFVCASDNGHSEPDVIDAKAVSENTPMAVMLTRKWAYDALIAKDGYFFDEGYFMWASDCDLALRMAACGIRGVQLDTPFWHYGSASHKMPENHLRSCKYGDEDRAYFERKWGFKCDSLEYGQRPSDPNFRAERIDK